MCQHLVTDRHDDYEHDEHEMNRSIVARADTIHIVCKTEYSISFSRNTRFWQTNLFFYNLRVSLIYDNDMDVKISLTIQVMGVTFTIECEFTI